jgi:AraC-like DNA-binding protein
MPTTRISATFEDVGELGRVAGWDLGFRQIDDGSSSIPARLVSDGRVTIVGMRLDRGYHQLGTPPPGAYSFGIPTGRMRDWFGRPYPDLAILPFNQRGGIDGVSGSGFSAYTVSFDKGFIEETRKAFGIPMPAAFGKPDPESVIAAGAENVRFRRSIDRLANNDGCPLDRPTADDLAVSLLGASLSERALKDKSTPASRSRSVNRALAYIAEFAGDNPTVRDLCIASGAALRTLDRGFKERFGVGPKAYLQRARLGQARKELLLGISGTLVADVANAAGFWHMGQFARDYRKLFGELPSETLRRTNHGSPLRVTIRAAP